MNGFRFCIFLDDMVSDFDYSKTVLNVNRSLYSSKSASGSSAASRFASAASPPVRGPDFYYCRGSCLRLIVPRGEKQYLFKKRALPQNRRKIFHTKPRSAPGAVKILYGKICISRVSIAQMKYCLVEA